MTQPKSRWRAIAEPIIARVLQETAGKPEREIKAALKRAYPFGPRKMHPYRIWCDEVRKQRGLPTGKDAKTRAAEKAGQGRLEL